MTPEEQMLNLSQQPAAGIEDTPLTDSQKEANAVEAMQFSIETQASVDYEVTQARKEQDEFKLVEQQIVDVGKTFASTALGAPADLIAVGTALGYNAYNVAQGGSFHWPKSFKDIPATGDWYANKMGLDVEDPNYIIGSVISPSIPTKVAAVAKAAGFFGLGALTVDHDMVKMFEKLEKDGASIETLMQKTKLYRGTSDGKIRFAVSDADMKVNDLSELMTAQHKAKFKNVSTGTASPLEFTLDQVIDHALLFEAYPQLRKYKVVLAVEEMDGGAYRVWNKDVGNNLANFQSAGDSGVGTITLNKGYDAKRSLIHEIQHAVQEIEGFSFGANTSPYSNALDMMREAQQSQRIAGRIQSNASSLNRRDIVKMLVQEGFDKEAIEANIGSFDLIRKATTRGELDVIEAQLDFYRMAEDKSLNILGAMLGAVRPENIDNFETALRKMSVFEIESLINERYLRQGGEVEARLAEALSNVRQEKMDKLAITPEQLLDAVNPETGELIDIAQKVGVRTTDMIP